ncbi:MAG TPA: TRAM domain-containing protein [Gemmatimonadales bacterium]|nr:TRAM domain-containing protein [Gemmatimonadales bacterium]
MSPDAPVRILRIASGGDGVGRLEDGRTVFVPRTAPGDLVLLSRERTYARYVRARIGAIVAPGPGRVEPRCIHYVRDDCGGCQLQHLDQVTQLAAKRAIVADALARIAHLDLPVAPVIAGSRPWQYRSRISLRIGPALRLAGFHPLDQPGRVFELEHCDLAAPALMELWTALRPRLHLLPPDAEQLTLRVARDGGRHLVVRARGAEAWRKPERLAQALAAAGAPATIWWQPGGGAARVVGRGETFPATVFEQVNPDLGDQIRAWAVEQLGIRPGMHVWDLYAGIGEGSALIRAQGATVESVELDPRAVELAASRSGGRNEGIRRHTGKVEDFLRRLDDADGVIANPPRAGLSERVRIGLLERRPPAMVYVSCDPATLARDLEQLAGGPAPQPYRVTAVQPFDLFPETAHVEAVAVLEAT